MVLYLTFFLGKSSLYFTKYASMRHFILSFLYLFLHSHLKTSKPDNEYTTETFASDPGSGSCVVHQSGLPEDIHAASVHVCEVMDKIGYSKAMVRHRKGVYRNTTFNMQDRCMTITGSNGEGLSTPFESDTDYLCLFKYTKCRLLGHACKQLPDTHSVFIMDGEHCHPGHFWLELNHMGTEEDTNIKASLFVHTNGKTYLSSQKFTKRQSTIEHTTSLSGPAVTHTFQSLSCDTVVALPIQQPMLSEWISRPRHHNWPSPELIQEIFELPAYLVPVGCKGSETKHMEWRVGFLGEQKLTDSFTECQYKLYIILKILMKTELKPLCDEMSSYIVKNIVFWFIESNQQELFSKENILKNLLSCLQKLQQAIRDDRLSYYMIPGRNLLIGRINQSQQQQLIAKLDELIQEGPRVILRCPKVLEALYNMSPTELTEKGHTRDELEKLFLERYSRYMTYWRPGIEIREWMMLGWGDPYCNNVTDMMYDKVWPLWRLYPKEGVLDILDRKIQNVLL